MDVFESRKEFFTTVKCKNIFSRMICKHNYSYYLGIDIGKVYGCNKCGNIRDFH